MGEAINLTEKLYPGFLQRQPALHFMLKVQLLIGLHDISQISLKFKNEFFFEHYILTKFSGRSLKKIRKEKNLQKIRENV